MIRNENEPPKMNTSKGNKYSDEGRDGDYNTPSTEDTSIEEGDEDYDDEEEGSQYSPTSENESKDEKQSYVSYDGNNDNTPPSR